MRCQCCNRNLSDIESTRRHAETNQFLDICNKCIPDLGIPYLDRDDLGPTLEDDDVEDVDNTVPEVPDEWEG